MIRERTVRPVQSELVDRPNWRHWSSIAKRKQDLRWSRPNELSPTQRLSRTAPQIMAFATAQLPSVLHFCRCHSRSSNTRPGPKQEAPDVEEPGAFSGFLRVNRVVSYITASRGVSQLLQNKY